MKKQIKIPQSLKPKVKFCPSCDRIWNGVECKECGFDSGCFDPHYDLD